MFICFISIFSCGFDNASFGLFLVGVVILIIYAAYYRNTKNIPKTKVIYRDGKPLKMVVNPFNLNTLKILDTFLSRINPLDETVRTVAFSKKEYEALIGVKKINIAHLRTYTDQLQDCKVVLPLENGYSYLPKNSIDVDEAL